MPIVQHDRPTHDCQRRRHLPGHCRSVSVDHLTSLNRTCLAALSSQSAYECESQRLLYIELNSLCNGRIGFERFIADYKMMVANWDWNGEEERVKRLASALYMPGRVRHDVTGGAIPPLIHVWTTSETSQVSKEKVDERIVQTSMKGVIRSTRELASCGIATCFRDFNQGSAWVHT